MQSTRKLISSWRKWLNRNHTFDKKELDEMEDHMIEEIDYLVKRKNLTEEEAFHKAAVEMGKREVLDKDFRKGRVFSIIKLKSWIHSEAISLLLITSLIIGFLITDSIYSSNHILKEKEKFRFIVANLHKVGFNWDDTPLTPPRDFPWQTPIILHQVEKDWDKNSLQFTENFPWEKSKINKNIADKLNQEILSKNNHWGREKYWMPNQTLARDKNGFLEPVENKKEAVEPKYYTQLYLSVNQDITESNPYNPFFVVIDSVGQIWLDSDGVFNDSRLFHEASDMYQKLTLLREKVKEFSDKKPMKYVTEPEKFKYFLSPLLLQYFFIDSEIKSKNRIPTQTKYKGNLEKIDPLLSNNTFGPFTKNSFVSIELNSLENMNYYAQLFFSNEKAQLIFYSYQQKLKPVHILPFLFTKVKDSINRFRGT